MREKKSFIERTSVRKSNQVRVKYFLVYEGAVTEDIYFDAINSHKNELGINPIIELIPLIRDAGEEGWSNPQKIVDRIIQNVIEAESGEMTYDVLINRIVDYLTSDHIIGGGSQARTFYKTLKMLCQAELGKCINDRVDDIDATIISLIELLKKNCSINNITDKIVDFVKELSITYDSEIDHICIIVDRDKDSFVVNDKINQYQYVIDSCMNNGFDFYVTNPCFEFWLLLHFDDVNKLDNSKLINNCRVNKKMRYTEFELSKRMDFKKNKYDADELVKKLPKAISNEKKYCEDLLPLENHVGSNLGKLFEEIMVAD